MKQYRINGKSLKSSLFSTVFAFITLLVVTGLVFQPTNFFNRAYDNLLGRKANIAIDLNSPTVPLNPNWKYFAQGGEQKGVGLTSAVEQMKVLGPSYVRFDHVFDSYDVVGRSSDGRLTYDFSLLDAEIRNIQSMGAKPFISVSYMPSAISKGNEVDIPRDWNEWSQSVRALVEHISGRQNLAISDVYYEIWNEPDLFGDFKLYGDKNYLTLYKYAHDGANSAANVLPFKIGGPATTALYKNWFDGFLSFADKNNLRVDFYSWHKYSYDIDDYITDIQTARKWITDHPKFFNSTFVLSEFGPNSDVDPSYDTSQSAYHTLSMYAATLGRLDMAFLFEIKDGKGQNKYWGRWGMLTHESYGSPEAKPRYQAIAFLNNLKGGRLFHAGDGTWVKAIATYNANERTVQLLLINYDQYNSHAESVPVKIQGLTGSSVTITKLQFLGGTSTFNEAIVNGTWETAVIMPPNSAYLYDLKIN